MAGVECPHCGHQNPPKASWCEKCRRALPERSERAMRLRGDGRVKEATYDS